MTDVLVQPDCSLSAACERLDHCCLEAGNEPGAKRPPNTGARLWGRVRSKLLRQKVPRWARCGVPGGSGLHAARRGAWGLFLPRPVPQGRAGDACLVSVHCSTGGSWVRTVLCPLPQVVEGTQRTSVLVLGLRPFAPRQARSAPGTWKGTRRASVWQSACGHVPVSAMSGGKHWHWTSPGAADCLRGLGVSCCPMPWRFPGLSRWEQLAHKGWHLLGAAGPVSGPLRSELMVPGDVPAAPHPRCKSINLLLVLPACSWPGPSQGRIRSCLARCAGLSWDSRGLAIFRWMHPRGSIVCFATMQAPCRVPAPLSACPEARSRPGSQRLPCLAARRAQGPQQQFPRGWSWRGGRGESDLSGRCRTALILRVCLEAADGSGP